jgi:hypothetical protein
LAGVIAVTLGVGAVAAAAAQPSSTQPGGDRAASVGRWVRELADRDPDVRDRARVQLMGLDRAGLDTLRQVVADSRPIGPSQAAALQEIVNHVFLSSERDEAAEGAGGFLGVQLAPAGVEVSPPPQQQQQPAAAGAPPDGGPPQVGVAVAGRVPGFCGYRMLEDGDVILSLTAAARTVQFHSTSELIAAIGQQHAGDRITLGVLRRGKLVQVPVTLDAKPAWVGQLVPAADAMGPRQRRAAEYWDQSFAPLLKDGTS